MNAHQLYIATTILEKCAGQLRNLARQALADEAPLPPGPLNAYVTTLDHGGKLLRDAMKETSNGP